MSRTVKTLARYGSNIKRIVALGLPATLLIGGIFVFALKQLEKKGNVAITLAKRAERGNIDHILVGPKGLFTLEVKSHRGEVTFDGTIPVEHTI